VRHTVTATLTDQYGDPVSGVPVNFWSDAIVGDYGEAEGVRGEGGIADDADPFRDNDGLGGAKGTATAGNVRLSDHTDTDNDGVVDDGETVTYTQDDNFGGSDKTNRSGVARKSYNRDTDVQMTEIIGAVAVIGKRDGAATEPDGDDGDELPDQNREIDDIRADADADTDGKQDMRHYWAVEAGSAEVTGVARAVDTDANTVVIAIGGAANDDDGTNTLAKYDSNDQFNAGLATDTDAGGVKMATFEDDLEVGNTLVIDLASDPEPGVNEFRNNAAEVPDPDPCHV
jgi:hypothetical protein